MGKIKVRFHLAKGDKSYYFTDGKIYTASATVGGLCVVCDVGHTRFISLNVPTPHAVRLDGTNLGNSESYFSEVKP